MIRVTPAPEPPEFDRLVRKPGLSAIAELVGEPQSTPRPGRRIKKVAERRVLRARTRGCMLGVDVRHHPLWTGEAEEVHRHLRRGRARSQTLIRSRELLDFARRKAERSARVESRDRVRRIGPRPDPSALRKLSTLFASCRFSNARRTAC